MRVALYLEDGTEQIVLTPETDLEKTVLAKISAASRTLTIKHGSFYDCRGGWARYRPYAGVGMWRDDNRDDESTILILSQAQEAANETPSATRSEGTPLVVGQGEENDRG